jgi:hypothetical protein
LAYRLGLRRSEIKYRLQQDIGLADGLLYVFSNHHYRLKTASANRRVPFTLFLDATEQNYLQALSHLAKQEHDHNRGRLFNVSDSEFAQLCARVTEALQAATQDQRVRLHDGRHSFASHLTWFGVIDPTSLLYSEVKSWCRMEPQSFKALWLEVTTGQKANQGHKFMNTLSLVIGHSTAQTTLTHYAHELSLLSLESQSTYKTHFNHMEQKSLVDWFGISQVNGRKITSRSSFSDDISLMQRALSSWQLHTVMQLQRREKPMLQERLSESVQYDHWLETLQALRHLMHTTQQSPLQQVLFDVFQGREANVPLDLSLDCGAMTANKHLTKRVRRVLASSTLVSLLRHCQKLSITTIREAAESALFSFHVKLGYFVTNAEIGTLNVFKDIGLDVVVEQNIVLKTAKFQRHGCTAHLRWQRRDVTDDFFVLAIIICTSYR